MSLFLSHKKRWSISLMCEVLQVSRSGYYRWLPIREKLIERLEQIKPCCFRELDGESQAVWLSPYSKRCEEVKKTYLFQRILISSIMKYLCIASFYQRKKFRKPYERGEITVLPP